MMTIAEQWASYEAEVVPKDAPEVQRVECRRAFYAGAFAALLGAESYGQRATLMAEARQFAEAESKKVEARRGN